MKKKLPFHKLSQKDLLNRITILNIYKEIQCSSGNFDYSPYMHGMANGIILALSVLNKEDPCFIDKIETYICDKRKQHERPKRVRRRKRKA